jgi:D-sedoheptulose 7-phosphate isomerase
MNPLGKASHILLETQLADHLAVLSSLRELGDNILAAGEALIAAISGGKKLLVCGNGGSAADAQHFAAELVGRFERERRAWPAIALTTDTSVLTAIGNDYSFETIFPRQVEALGTSGDILLCLSTSGNSLNVIRAVEVGKANNLKTIGLLGKGGGPFREAVDLSIVVDAHVTARIQEAHGFILHFWCSMIEERITQFDNERNEEPQVSRFRTPSPTGKLG